MLGKYKAMIEFRKLQFSQCPTLTFRAFYGPFFILLLSTIFFTVEKIASELFKGSSKCLNASLHCAQARRVEGAAVVAASLFF